MATLRMVLSAPYLATANAAKIAKTPTDQRKEDVLVNVANLMTEIAGGRRQNYGGQALPSFQLSIDQSATAATGTVTFLTVANNSTIQVGGITFTGKTGTPSGSVQFKCGVSPTADAAAFCAAVNANATTSQYASAANVSGVATITATIPGLIGNAIILASSDGTNLAVVAMASGANDPAAQTYQF